jgi:general secretion pathway protein M
MIDRFRSFWAARSTREQQMLLVMFVLLAIVVVGFGIARPLANARTAAEARLERVTLESGQVTATAERLRLAQKDAPPALTVALSLAVSQSATAAGFTLATLDPQGEDRIGITIPSAKSPALFAWLSQLAGQGVFVERMTLRTGSDATVAVEATLRARSK